MTQRRYAPWWAEGEGDGVSDLCGKTLEEVEYEVRRIQVGDHSSSLGKFDCYLHSWEYSMAGQIID